jgi:hypothetical protein
MINYKYTDINHIENPCKYMYTPYQGPDFLSAYFYDRFEYIKKLQSKHETLYQNQVDEYLYLETVKKLEVFINRELTCKDDKLLLSIIYKNNSANINKFFIEDINSTVESIHSFNVDDDISSEKLLTAILLSQVNGQDESLVKVWLDRLVQRFEVTKNFYKIYLSGFRSGKGATDELRLYWLFALSLVMIYSTEKNIKYLSTLLKVSDFLCSLNQCLLNKGLHTQGFSFILLIEVLSVKILCKDIKEVNFVFE